MFQDDGDPTADEIRRWASSPDASLPMEDWDLVLASISENDRLYVELAGSDLPAADSFLRCLYIIVGDAVRTSWSSRSRAQIEHLRDAGLHSSDPSVRKWALAARRVLDHPDSFNAEDWIHGGAATDDDAV